MGTLAARTRTITSDNTPVFQNEMLFNDIKTCIVGNYMPNKKILSKGRLEFFVRNNRLNIDYIQIPFSFSSDQEGQLELLKVQKEMPRSHIKTMLCMIEMALRSYGMFDHGTFSISYQMIDDADNESRLDADIFFEIQNHHSR